MAYYTASEVQYIDQYVFEFLQVEIAQNTLVVTLNRPEKRNAMHPPLLNELAFAFAYAHHTTAIWNILLQANGPVFCAGADLKAFREDSTSNSSTIPAPTEKVLIGEVVRRCLKPCICKVHANAYAGAFLLLANASFVVAEKGVLFSLPEVKRGIFPFQVMAALMEIMPGRKAMEWSLTGRSVTATEALEAGLLTHLAAEGQLDEVVQQVLEQLSFASPSAIRMGMKAYRKLCIINTSENQAYLSDMLQQTLQTQDAKEGIMAFKEKRKPIWEGL
ncbi:enoyl-CoA hydratase-related protein [Algivirga pacifica]|uniref:Enoyl-CoA hydratase/isomerase family protein n=1 Tax=Algivirga pacifica TaxID=1162670 RepID=A0ABP9DBN6_9BACT